MFWTYSVLELLRNGNKCLPLSSVCNNEDGQKHVYKGKNMKFNIGILWCARMELYWNIEKSYWKN